MISIIQELIVLSIIILGGVVCAKLKVLSQEGVIFINNFTIKISLPALIISSMNKNFTYEMLRNSLGLIVISFACYGVLIIGFAVWGSFSKLNLERLRLYQFLIIFGNTAFMGFPIISAIYGELGVFYSAVFNLAHNFVCFSYGLSLLQKGNTFNIKKAFLNPAFISTIIGCLIFVIPISLPYLIYKPIELVGNMTIPLCLLVVGYYLSNLKIKELLYPLSIWLTSLIRLIVFPMVIYTTLSLIGFKEYLLIIPTIIFATPVALSAATFVAHYGNDDRIAAKAVVLSNFLAIITMPIVILFAI